MSERHSSRLTDRRLDLLAVLIPPAVVLAMFVAYLVSPGFYLRWILEFTHRERQLVEILTILSAATAAVILLAMAVVLWRAELRAGKRLPSGAALFIAMVGSASLFFAGEEASWGQTYFRWRTPEKMQHVSRETNIHNGPLGKLVHNAANVFLLSTLVVAPVAWHFRDRLRLPADLRPAVAEWPVAVTALFGMAIRGPKELFASLHTDAELKVSTFYWQYLEQLPEQKEMVVAFALLIYALYRVQAVWRERETFIAPA